MNALPTALSVVNLTVGVDDAVGRAHTDRTATKWMNDDKFLRGKGLEPAQSGNARYVRPIALAISWRILERGLRLVTISKAACQSIALTRSPTEERQHVQKQQMPVDKAPEPNLPSLATPWISDEQFL